jgi:hypothetical protein
MKKAMKRTAGSLLTAAAGLGAVLALAAGTASSGPKLLVTLASLVPAGDPLARQDLRFDARFAALALDYFKAGDERLLAEIPLLPATAHLLAHARNFDYDVPKDSPQALVGSLLAPSPDRSRDVVTCEESLAYFTGPMLEDPHWVLDALAYLPPGFRFHGSLFLTFGYDIGVAFPPNASLNGAQRHFGAHPRELVYYAIHELHHAGFMSYQPPPRLADLKTCRDVLGLVRYSTALEGMAVLAAWPRRRAEKALADDPDYVALGDSERMRRDVAAYFRDYDSLVERGDMPADKEAWAVIDGMSSGERLWYRVGALLARRFEEVRGRAALVGLVTQGPIRFVEAARPLLSGPESIIEKRRPEDIE